MSLDEFPDQLYNSKIYHSTINFLYLYYTYVYNVDKITSEDQASLQWGCSTGKDCNWYVSNHAWTKILI